MTGSRPLRADEPTQLGMYRLTAFLGEGGQGIVYLGNGPSGGKVAVKVLQARLAGDDKARSRFLREVEAVKRVAEFCVARVIDSDFNADRPYIVSEFVEGVSLQEAVVTDGPRERGGLERLAIGTATALVAIHQAGIVHRDFKPGNVLLGPDGPRVVDFGIARALGSAASESSGLVGTPGYMSPEQISGQPLTPATDLFSWAATILFAATGVPPFGNDSVPAVMYRILHYEPDLTVLPPPLRDAVGAGLAKDPGRRPAAADIMLTLLGRTAVRQGLEGAGAVTPPVMGQAAPGPADLHEAMRIAAGEPLEPAGVHEEPGRPTAQGGLEKVTFPSAPAESAVSVRSRRFIFIAVVTAVAIMAGVLTWAVLPGEPARRRPPAPRGPAESAPLPWGTEIGAPLTGHTDHVGAVAAGQVGGRSVILSGGHDKTIRMWDLTTHRADGPPLTGHTREVYFVATGYLHDRPVALSGSADNTVRLWDLTSRQSVGPPIGGDTDWARTGAIGRLDGQDIAVVGGFTNTIRRWNLDTGRPLGPPLTGHTDSVYSLALGRLGGRPIIASAGEDRTIRIWDLSSGRPLGPPLTGHTRTITAVALGQLGGRPIAVSAGEDRTVRVWDLTTSRPIGGPLTGHTDSVLTIALTRVGGRTVAVTGSDDNGIRAWDLGAHKPLGAPFTGHTDSVEAVTCAALGRQPVLVSAGWDRTLRVWSLTPPP
ncbi:WD40 repeat domain-containing serine/threonine protein kinase [Actinomadura scrupuli]|uniref:WD40 repeat domain-containing serine/threonine protein kinase n=1 Tax=Actinomadura scrupuli TaxID=559629 RepID=UPI003D96FA86